MKLIAKNSGTLLEVIHSQTGMKKTKIRDFVKYRRISVNNEVVNRVDIQVNVNDQICIDYDNKQNVSSKKSPLPVVFEDENFIAVQKPAGIITSGEDVNDNPTLLELVNLYLYEKKEKQTKAFVIHRLDKEVSGIVLFAKSEKLQQWMKNNWQNNEKYYYAFVEGCPRQEQGRIETYLIDTETQKVVVTDDKNIGKLAITHYKLLKKIGKNSLLEIKLETGRKNQIRVHLAHIGCPIVGDRKYGADASVARQIRLFAYKLVFWHPVLNKKITLTIEPPANFTVYSIVDEKYK